MRRGCQRILKVDGNRDACRGWRAAVGATRHRDGLMITPAAHIPWGVVDHDMAQCHMRHRAREEPERARLGRRVQVRVRRVAVDLLASTKHEVAAKATCIRSTHDPHGGSLLGGCIVARIVRVDVAVTRVADTRGVLPRAAADKVDGAPVRQLCRLCACACQGRCAAVSRCEE